MTLSEYLRVPYVILAFSSESADGRWLRCVKCPELPGCEAEAVSIVDALEELDRKRVEVIVGLLREGRRPPVPRPPLRNADPISDLRHRGLLRDFESLLELEDREIVSTGR